MPPDIKRHMAQIVFSKITIHPYPRLLITPDVSVIGYVINRHGIVTIMTPFITVDTWLILLRDESLFTLDARRLMLGIPANASSRQGCMYYHDYYLISNSPNVRCYFTILY